MCPKKQPKPPLASIMLLLGIALFLVSQSVKPFESKTLPERNGMSGISIVEGSYLIGEAIPPQRFQTLGSLGELGIPEVMERVIFCESTNDPEAYNPESGAKGLCQVIPSSEKFCEKGLGRELDMFNPKDNLDCADYLMEHGGLAHWQASYQCWGK